MSNITAWSIDEKGGKNPIIISSDADQSLFSEKFGLSFAVEVEIEGISYLAYYNQFVVDRNPTLIAMKRKQMVSNGTYLWNANINGAHAEIIISKVGGGSIVHRANMTLSDIDVVLKLINAPDQRRLCDRCVIL